MIKSIVTFRPSSWVKDVLSDPNRSRYFPRFGSDEVQCLERVLDRVAEGASLIRQRFPVLPAATLVPVSMMLVVANPGERTDILSLKVAMTLWAIAFDDALDDGKLSEPDVMALCKECREVARRKGCPVTTDLGLALQYFTGELAQCSSWDVIRPVWIRSFDEFLRSSFFGYRASNNLAVFSRQRGALKRYLFHARRSIALPWLLVSALVLRENRSVLGDMPSVVDLATTCGEAVRMANDLASASREASEGTVNAVGLVAFRLQQEGADEEAALAAARQRVEMMLELALRRVHTKAQHTKTASDVAARFARLTEISVEFQRRGDIRHFSPERFGEGGQEDLAGRNASHA